MRDVLQETTECAHCCRQLPVEPGWHPDDLRECFPCAHVGANGRSCFLGSAALTPQSRDVLELLPHWTDALDLGPDLPDATQYNDSFGEFLIAYDEYLSGKRAYEDLPILKSGAV